MTDRINTLTEAMVQAIVQRVSEGLDEDYEDVPRSMPRLSYQQMEEAIEYLAEKRAILHNTVVHLEDRARDRIKDGDCVSKRLTLRQRIRSLWGKS
jgi:hypothetical protein